jgi:hypothetical protein
MADVKIAERAEVGKEILGSRVAQGEPGTPQPKHTTGLEGTQDAVDQLASLADEISPNEVYASSAERAEQSGNPNGPAHERDFVSDSPASKQPYNDAVGHIAAARTALEQGATADARLLSDPRYENDQKIFELGQAGKLRSGVADPEGLVAQGIVSADVAETLPSTTVEQAEEDKKKLEDAENSGVVLNPNVTGVDEGKDKGSEVTPVTPINKNNAVTEVANGQGTPIK